MAKLTTYQVTEIAKDTWAINEVNRSPSSRQLKKYKFFLPVEIYLLAGKIYIFSIVYLTGSGSSN